MNLTVVDRYRVFAATLEQWHGRRDLGDQLDQLLDRGDVLGVEAFMFNQVDPEWWVDLLSAPLGVDP